LCETAHGAQCSSTECEKVCGAVQAFLQLLVGRDQTSIAAQLPAESTKIKLLLAIAEHLNDDGLALDDLLDIRHSVRGRKNGMRERLLNLAEVEEKIGLKKSVIYDRMSRAEFPAPLKIGKATRWRESDVELWITQHNEG